MSEAEIVDKVAESLAKLDTWRSEQRTRTDDHDGQSSNHSGLQDRH